MEARGVVPRDRATGATPAAVTATGAPPGSDAASRGSFPSRPAVLPTAGGVQHSSHSALLQPSLATRGSSATSTAWRRIAAAAILRRAKQRARHRASPAAPAGAATAAVEGGIPGQPHVMEGGVPGRPDVMVLDVPGPVLDPMAPVPPAGMPGAPRGGVRACQAACAASAPASRPPQGSTAQLHNDGAPGGGQEQQAAVGRLDQVHHQGHAAGRRVGSNAAAAATSVEGPQAAAEALGGGAVPPQQGEVSWQICINKWDLRRGYLSVPKRAMTSGAFGTSWHQGLQRLLSAAPPMRAGQRVMWHPLDVVEEGSGATHRLALRAYIERDDGGVRRWRAHVAQGTCLMRGLAEGDTLVFRAGPPCHGARPSFDGSGGGGGGTAVPPIVQRPGEGAAPATGTGVPGGTGSACGAGLPQPAATAARVWVRRVPRQQPPARGNAVRRQAGAGAGVGGSSSGGGSGDEEGSGPDEDDVPAAAERAQGPALPAPCAEWPCALTARHIGSTGKFYLPVHSQPGCGATFRPYLDVLRAAWDTQGGQPAGAGAVADDGGPTLEPPETAAAPSGQPAAVYLTDKGVPTICVAVDNRLHPAEPASGRLRLVVRGRPPSAKFYLLQSDVWKLLQEAGLREGDTITFSRHSVPQGTAAGQHAVGAGAAAATPPRLPVITLTCSRRHRSSGSGKRQQAHLLQEETGTLAEPLRGTAPALSGNKRLCTGQGSAAAAAALGGCAAGSADRAGSALTAEAIPTAAGLEGGLGGSALGAQAGGLPSRQPVGPAPGAPAAGTAGLAAATAALTATASHGTNAPPLPVEWSRAITAGHMQGSCSLPIHADPRCRAVFQPFVDALLHSHGSCASGAGSAASAAAGQLAVHLSDKGNPSVCVAVDNRLGARPGPRAGAPRRDPSSELRVVMYYSVCTMNNHFELRGIAKLLREAGLREGDTLAFSRSVDATGQHELGTGAAATPPQLPVLPVLTLTCSRCSIKSNKLPSTRPPGREEEGAAGVPATVPAAAAVAMPFAQAPGATSRGDLEPAIGLPPSRSAGAALALPAAGPAAACSAATAATAAAAHSRPAGPAGGVASHPLQAAATRARDQGQANTPPDGAGSAAAHGQHSCSPASPPRKRAKHCSGANTAPPPPHQAPDCRRAAGDAGSIAAAFEPVTPHYAAGARSAAGASPPDDYPSPAGGASTLALLAPVAPQVPAEAVPPTVLIDACDEVLAVVEVLFPRPSMAALGALADALNDAPTHWPPVRQSQLVRQLLPRLRGAVREGGEAGAQRAAVYVKSFLAVDMMG